MNFDEAFTTLLGHEGSYSNHPTDPGGETMWGITWRVARAHGYHGLMKDMPVEVAKNIYYKVYWTPVKGDELPSVIRYAVFDAAVNSGPHQAALWLQRAAKVDDDGKIGKNTLAAAKAMDPYDLKMRVLSERLTFMTNLPTWSAFGKGWARRIASLMKT